MNKKIYFLFLITLNYSMTLATETCKDRSFFDNEFAIESVNDKIFYKNFAFSGFKSNIIN